MALGCIFDIQPYAVHDGPGIRTLVFLKGCPLSCKWCCNPESQAFTPDLRFESMRCMKCLRCMHACPSCAIVGVDGMPMVDRECCAVCDTFSCVRDCPGKALVKVGRETSAQDLVAEVAKDEAFFRNSGGGVTFSGGEPFAQAEFLLEALKLFKARGISTAIETCGYYSQEDLEAAEPFVDHFLFDLKVMDPERHKALTGRDNGLIHANLAWLAGRCPGKVVVRHAIIPGHNDDPANHQAIADFMVAKGLERLDLEPYHPLGEPKYEGIGLTCPCTPDARALTGENLSRLQTFFQSMGLVCEMA